MYNTNRLSLLACAILALAATPATLTHSQERISDQLALARICASEAGLPRRTDAGYAITADCAAIHEALRFGAERLRVTWLTQARAYSGRVFDPERTDSRAWISHLSPSAEQPTGWPVGTVQTRRGSQLVDIPAPTWSHYRGAWQALYAHAGAIVRGEVRHECSAPISDWGGDMDRARALRLRMIEVTCGQTRNTFYLRRSWAEEELAAQP